jgi:hypothetical protein
MDLCLSLEFLPQLARDGARPATSFSLRGRGSPSPCSPSVRALALPSSRAATTGRLPTVPYTRCPSPRRSLRKLFVGSFAGDENPPGTRHPSLPSLLCVTELPNPNWSYLAIWIRIWCNYKCIHVQLRFCCKITGVHVHAHVLLGPILFFFCVEGLLVAELPCSFAGFSWWRDLSRPKTCI